MNEPQIWTLIGVFAGVMLGGFTLSTGLLTRVIRSGFEAVDAKFAAVDARFEAVNARLDHLDRDVSALMRRAWQEGDER
ncbi:MAG: hypothetical protein DI534_03315 [Leifsonia xyli]|nr:MAG: hypothetical protein DI534_03315 [Leifsonia xyli]